MSFGDVLVTAGPGVLCVAGYIVALSLGQGVSEQLKNAIFRRGALPIRRQRNRGYLKSGYLVLVGFGFLPAFIGTVAATNGTSDGPRDARWFFAVAGAGLVVGAILLLEWWRRSARP